MSASYCMLSASSMFWSASLCMAVSILNVLHRPDLYSSHISSCCNISVSILNMLSVGYRICQHSRCICQYPKHICQHPVDLSVILLSWKLNEIQLSSKLHKLFLVTNWVGGATLGLARKEPNQCKQRKRAAKGQHDSGNQL